MKNCLEILLENNPREMSGSATSSSYDYQKNWGILLLIEKHKAEDNYLVFFDYHEDIIFFDSPNDPKICVCFQIKRKNKNTWTLASLIKQNTNKKTGNKSSILGKLAINKILFKDYVQKLCFVSNVIFNVKLENGGNSSDKNSICLFDLSETEKKQFLQKLDHEYKGDSQELLKLIYLEKSALPYDNSDTYVKGALSEFLESLDSTRNFNIGLIYKTLFDEIRRKTGYSYILNQFEDIQNKSISRIQFDEILSSLIQKDEYNLVITQAEKQLQAESVDFAELRKYRLASKNIEVKLMNKNDTIIELIEKEASEFCQNPEISRKLSDNLSEFYNLIIRKYPKYSILDRHEVGILLLREMYE